MATYTDQEMLDATRTAIHSALTDGYAELSAPDGRSSKTHSLSELQALERHYRRAVAVAKRPLIRLPDVSGGPLA